MAVAVSNITKYFGHQVALDDVTFTVKEGEIIGLLGPNGAGKSTLMKIITGFIRQSSGRVEVNGTDTLTDEYDFRKAIGYLPESNPLYYDMYVREYLQWVASVYKLKGKRQRVDRLIELTGIGPERHKKIGALSKGYKQRVGLAQALIHDPSVIILDEPTSGLDPNQIIEIRELIKTVGRDKTVILSTHIMQEVEAVCQRVIIINRGRIITDGPTAEIRGLAGQSRQNVLVEFAGEIAEERLNKLPFTDSLTRIGSNTWLIGSSENEDIRPKLFRFAAEQGYTLLTLQKKNMRLEEVFQSLTQTPTTNN